MDDLNISSDPPVLITPAIRTRYRAYLLTDEWRTRRNRILKLVAYRCERCGAKRGIEVHHKTYERLGCEQDQDLEALCPDCHREHHIQNPADSFRIYLKIAGEVVRENPFAVSADLSEALKVRCAKLHISYDSEKINKALSLICGKSLAPQPVVRRDGRLPDPQEISKADAREILIRLGLSDFIKTMPRSPGNRRIDIYGPIERDEVLHDRY
jgi:hypothetical protein